MERLPFIFFKLDNNPQHPYNSTTFAYWKHFTSKACEVGASHIICILQTKTSRQETRILIFYLQYKTLVTENLFSCISLLFPLIQLQHQNVC